MNKEDYQLDKFALNEPYNSDKWTKENYQTENAWI